MPWTNPKTWSVGETLTAANFNTHIRDNELALGPHLINRKTSDQSVTSSTAFVSDTALQLTVAANEVWLMHFVVRWEGSAVGDIKMSFSLPASGQIDATASGAFGTAASAYQDVGWLALTTSDTQPFAFPGAGAGSPRITMIDGTYIGAGTAGTVILRWAQNTSDATATKVLTNSTLWAVKLA